MADVWISAAEYYTGLDPDHFQVPPRDGLAESFESGIGQEPGDALRLAAEMGGELVGWASARIEQPAEDAAAQLTREHAWTRLVIDALIVGRSAWRQGAGTVLMQACEAWGRERGAVIARLDTYARSPVSVPFYEDRMGYQRRAIIFQKDLR